MCSMAKSDRRAVGKQITPIARLRRCAGPYRKGRLTAAFSCDLFLEAFRLDQDIVRIFRLLLKAAPNAAKVRPVPLLAFVKSFRHLEIEPRSGFFDGRLASRQRFSLKTVSEHAQGFQPFEIEQDLFKVSIEIG